VNPFITIKNLEEQIYILRESLSTFELIDRPEVVAKLRLIGGLLRTWRKDCLA
jgi:hypothetical protein